ncbi:MAG: single-stranded DNA-binding protein [Candidatus Magasanikbacteria bacterium CG_4_10_14_0_2_um_filter_33_14]|uniref:Single-stranded DNA-binding protein n=1 Tax=Candidatus Magasanikbacteria bacterium CG_4_10_14_0_2_um_filter_33_14 TaxID=1974636 RepID=A0A2M7VA54_9BACT|nr:MAG: single-stranded DNA-binding protein [Candidatus Magasanikbacteria bacterium CG_4_10_14_0_2_um_filter_33_14]
MDLNRATIIGRLTRDPEVKTTPSGQTVANLSAATNRVWTDKSGVKQEKVEFHNIVIWGKLAEIAGQYLSKGRQVYLEGRLETRDWTGQDGVKKYRTEIVADNMIMLGGNNSGAGKGSFGNDTSVSNDNTDQSSSDSDEIKVEDIPF